MPRSTTSKGITVTWWFGLRSTKKPVACLGHLKTTQALSDRPLTNVRLAAELSALTIRTSSRPSSSGNNYRGKGQTFNPTNARRPQHQFYNRRGSGTFTSYHPSTAPRVDFPSTRPDDATEYTPPLLYFQRVNTVSHHLLRPLPFLE